LSARRRIPAQAFWLKKYRRGRSPVSKISDNEHTPPSLWDGARVAVHSDILSVKDSVGPPIPAFAQEPEEGTKVPSFVRRQEAGHVLENQPTGLESSSKRKELEGQVAARVIQSEALAGD
jgi:hypothetical protein